MHSLATRTSHPAAWDGCTCFAGNSNHRFHTSPRLPSTLPSELPRNRCPPHDGRYLLPQPLFHHLPPRYQAETHAVVQHHEATAGELDRTVVDAVCALAFAQRAMK